MLFFPVRGRNLHMNLNYTEVSDTVVVKIKRQMQYKGMMSCMLNMQFMQYIFITTLLHPSQITKEFNF